MEFVNFENLQMWKFDTWKLEIIVFSIKVIPTTPQPSDSHPCTSPPLGGHECYPMFGRVWPSTSVFDILVHETI